MEVIPSPVGRNDDLRGEKTFQIRKGRLTRVDGFSGRKFPKTSLGDDESLVWGIRSLSSASSKATDKTKCILKNIQIRCSEQLVDILSHQHSSPSEVGIYWSRSVNGAV